MTWYTGNTMVLRFLQTIPSLGGIYHTNTNSYQTIPITDYLYHQAIAMASETSSIPRIPSSAPNFIDIERFFTREKAKARTLYVCLYCTAKPWKDGYKGNARRHLRNNHPYLMGLSSRQNQSQQSLDVYIT
ncbi:uncharacterized protein BKA55DRAFT_571110 [Fusarium redolens]|uniref:Uncharacterized protein n=1 Tax=Fusarium redolens TaxID=48865 RepID=A0A9P9GXI9_FUSRE|nr:uncharacterized protein BKA55DRAFT_571110 [Fusarium redolens]KAH7247240.1 hypothetical protein BKA55DRAFT_571110 [Fusarium redolens]